MAYIVMAYTVMAYIVMVHLVIVRARVGNLGWSAFLIMACVALVYISYGAQVGRP